MKKLLLSVCLLAATSLIATAQSGHGSFYVQYNLLGVGEEMKDYLDDIDAKSEHLNGLSVGFNKAFPITSSVPLFVEVGAGLTYAWAKVYDDEESEKCRMCYDDWSISQKVSSQHLMVSIPVNLMYKFQIPNSSITLEPYIGLNVKAHILGQQKTKTEIDMCCDDMEYILEEYLEEYGVYVDDLSGTEKLNYFDKKDMDGKKYVAKRVNIGWQIGANVDFGKAFVGISYGSDFNKFMNYWGNDWKFSATNFTVGLRF